MDSLKKQKLKQPSIDDSRKPKHDQWMLLLTMSLEEIFEEAAATAENGPVC